jgi:UDP-N-acetylglucosamine 2-epimerase (non-hydrolysing)
MNSDITIIHLIAAARPNFMKIAPLYHALKEQEWADPVIVHTGQHYDLNMSDAFFKDLRLPEPHIHLGVGSGSHAEQTGKVMMAYEKILKEYQPDMVIVVGDVNSTLACTIAATKITYPSKPIRRPLVAHLEAGLRSFDRSMPEEVNRLVTDTLADILWTPSPDGDAHLINEGVDNEKIVRVGNIMIDSLEMLREKIESQTTFKEFGLAKGGFGIITLHRPSNVDDQLVLEQLCRSILSIAEKIPLLFPVHPRTRKNLETHDLWSMLERAENLHLAEPIGYIRFMNLVFNCSFVLTDSGGIQEETTYLGIPCLTLRPNTERPITVTNGTNQLCTAEQIESALELILTSNSKSKVTIDLWDGKTAGRVVESIKEVMAFQLNEPLASEISVRKKRSEFHRANKPNEQN